MAITLVSGALQSADGHGAERCLRVRRPGAETLTIMRRSSSKRRSGRATGTPTPEAIGELDDTALEQQVSVVEDEPPLTPATMPSAELCENVSLRQVLDLSSEGRSSLSLSLCLSFSLSLDLRSINALLPV